jgi:hypothetical protein
MFLAEYKELAMAMFALASAAAMLVLGQLVLEYRHRTALAPVLIKTASSGPAIASGPVPTPVRYSPSSLP